MTEFYTFAGEHPWLTIALAFITAQTITVAISRIANTIARTANRPQIKPDQTQSRPKGYPPIADPRVPRTNTDFVRTASHIANQSCHWIGDITGSFMIDGLGPDDRMRREAIGRFTAQIQGYLDYLNERPTPPPASNQ